MKSVRLEVWNVDRHPEVLLDYHMKTEIKDKVTEVRFGLTTTAAVIRYFLYEDMFEKSRKY